MNVLSLSLKLESFAFKSRQTSNVFIDLTFLSPCDESDIERKMKREQRERLVFAYTHLHTRRKET